MTGRHWPAPWGGSKSARGSTVAASMDITQGRLISWLSDPIPSIQWRGIIDDRGHPATAGRRSHLRCVRQAQERCPPSAAGRDPSATIRRRLKHRARSGHPHLRHGDIPGRPRGNDPHHPTNAADAPPTRPGRGTRGTRARPHAGRDRAASRPSRGLRRPRPSARVDRRPARGGAIGLRQLRACLLLRVPSLSMHLSTGRSIGAS